MSRYSITFFFPGAFFVDKARAFVTAASRRAAIQAARKRAASFAEKPFGFAIATAGEKPRGVHFLGGKVLDAEGVRKERGLPRKARLLKNMKENGLKRIIFFTRPWKFSQFFSSSDACLQP